MAKTKFIDLGNKPLPANEEMEEIVLATIFSWKGFIFRVMNIIKPVMFYNDKLRNIMSSYFKVLNNNKDVTPLLLYEQIVKDKHKNVLEIYTEPRLFVSYWADIQFMALISADIFDDY
jgi:replicative DNA helicase